MSLARSSLIMASGTIVSRILGLVRTVMLAGAIGVATNGADAFAVANQLPNNVYAIIVGGLLNAVLVPQIVRAKVHKDGGKGYIDGLLTVIITAFALLTIVATLLAPVLVRIYTSGWNESTLALATAFAYWCLPQLFFYGLYSILGEVLNAKSSFGPFMWAPVINNLVAIVGLGIFVWLFGPVGLELDHAWTDAQISILAGTATLGVASQALILFFFWKRIGLRFTFNFKLRGLGLRPALKAASWTLAMLVITQIGGLIQTNLTSTTLAARASIAGDGWESQQRFASVAVAGIAWLIFMIPHSVGTVSIATAYFTRMSEHAHAQKFDLLKADVVRALRSILALSAFATSVMIVLSYPISRVFAPDGGSIAALGNVLIAMMFGLIPFSVNFMLQRVFYALEDTKSPLIFTTIQIVLFVIGCYISAAVVPAIGLVAAISLVMSASFAVQSVLAYRLLTKRIGSLASGRLGLYALQVIGVALVAGIAAFALPVALGGWSLVSFSLASGLNALIVCLGFTALAGTMYMGILWLLKNDEVRKAVTSVQGILRR